MADYEAENQMVPFSFFQSVIEMLPVAINIINEEQASVLSNSLFAEMFSWKDTFPFVDEIDQAFIFKTTINNYDCKVSTITGTEKTIHLLIEPLFDNEDVIGAVVIAMDITNINTYQKENAELIHTVEQLKLLLQQKQDVEAMNLLTTNKSSGINPDATQLDEDCLRDIVDYTSRDDKTWKSIRELRNNIKSHVPTYIYGDKGLEKRLMVKKILHSMRITRIQWVEIRTSQQIAVLSKVFELKDTFVIIDVELKNLIQPTIEMLQLLSAKEKLKWIMIGEEPLKVAENKNTITAIRILPLKERKGDILLLVEKLLPQNVKVCGEVKKRFIQYRWPKNIRELKSVLRYANSMRSPNENTIALEHIEAIGLINTMDKEVCMEGNKGIDMLLQTMDVSEQRMPDIFEKIEKKYIEKILLKSEYNITHTANKLGIKRQALQYKLKKYNLAPEEVLSKLN